MLKLSVCLFGLQLLFSVVLAENKTKDSLYFKFHQSDYEVVFEWAEVVSFKRPEVKEFKLRVFKFNRTCPAANATIGFNIDVGNELEVVLQVYKFASNEYRLFPLRAQVNFCKAFAYNLIGLNSVKNCGNFTGCPLRKGKLYHACNWTPDQAQFPPFIPTGRYMIEYQGFYRNKELYVLRGYGAVVRSIVRK